MATPQIPAPHPRLPRVYLKCASCRDRKRKCLPSDRRWHEEGQKCTDCINLKLSCGPNVPHNPQSPTETSPTIPIASPHTPLTTGSTTTSFLSTQASSASTSSRTDSSPVSPKNARAKFTKESSALAVQPESEKLVTDFPRRSITLASERIRKTFAELGPIYDLFAYLQGRQSAVDKFRSGLALSRSSEVEELITLVCDEVCTKLRYTIQRLLDLVDDECLDSDQQELFLRRSFEVTDRFVRIVPGTDSPDICLDYPTINIIQCTILERLIPIYKTCDEAEAYYYSQRLALLRNAFEGCHHVFGPELPHPVDAIRGMSSRINQSYKGFSIPLRLQRTLQNTTNVSPAIHLAILHQRGDVAEDLLRDNCPQTDSVDILNRGISHLLVETGNLDLLKKVLTQRPELGKVRDVFKLTALGVAAYSRKPEIFKALVELGCDITARDSSGRSVLCIASSAGDEEVVRYLLEEKQVNPNDVGIGECAPLFAAVVAGHENIVELLLRNGASPTQKFQGQTPYTEALAKDQFMIAAKLRQAVHPQDPSQPATQSGYTDIPVLPYSPMPIIDSRFAQTTSFNFVAPSSIFTAMERTSSSFESAEQSPQMVPPKRIRPPSRLTTPSPAQNHSYSVHDDRNVRQRL